MRKLLTIDEASEYLGISKLTLYGWVSARKLAFVKVGRLVKFKQDQLDKWIDQHTVKARVTTEDPCKNTGYMDSSEAPESNSHRLSERKTWD